MQLWLVFITQAVCVYCAAQTKSLSKIQRFLIVFKLWITVHPLQM